MPKLTKAQIIEAKRQMRSSGFIECYEDNRPIPPILDVLYMDLNKELFDDELPEDLPIVVNPRLNRSFGRAVCTSEGKGKRRGTRKNVKPVRIEISGTHTFTNRHMRKTMTHEMCHIWAFIKFGEVGHGQMFWKKMRELKYPEGHVFENQLSSERDKYCDY